MSIVGFIEKVFILDSSDDLPNHILIENCGEYYSELEGLKLYFPNSNYDTFKAVFAESFQGEMSTENYDSMILKMFQSTPDKLLKTPSSLDGRPYTEALMDYYESDVERIATSFGLAWTKPSTALEEDLLEEDLLEEDLKEDLKEDLEEEVEEELQEGSEEMLEEWESGEFHSTPNPSKESDEEILNRLRDMDSDSDQSDDGSSTDLSELEELVHQQHNKNSIDPELQEELSNEEELTEQRDVEEDLVEDQQVIEDKPEKSDQETLVEETSDDNESNVKQEEVQQEAEDIKEEVLEEDQSEDITNSELLEEEDTSSEEELIPESNEGLERQAEESSSSNTSISTEPGESKDESGSAENSPIVDSEQLIAASTVLDYKDYDQVTPEVVQMPTRRAGETPTFINETGSPAVTKDDTLSALQLFMESFPDLKQQLETIVTMISGRRSASGYEILSDEEFKEILMYLKSLGPKKLSSLFLATLSTFWRFGEVDIVSRLINEMVVHLETEDEINA